MLHLMGVEATLSIYLNQTYFCDAMETYSIFGDERRKSQKIDSLTESEERFNANHSAEIKDPCQQLRKKENNQLLHKRSVWYSLQIEKNSSEMRTYSVQREKQIYKMHQMEFTRLHDYH